MWLSAKLWEYLADCKTTQIEICAVMQREKTSASASSDFVARTNARIRLHLHEVERLNCEMNHLIQLHSEGQSMYLFLAII